MPACAAAADTRAVTPVEVAAAAPPGGLLLLLMRMIVLLQWRAAAHLDAAVHSGGLVLVLKPAEVYIREI